MYGKDQSSMALPMEMTKQNIIMNYINEHTFIFTSIDFVALPILVSMHSMQLLSMDVLELCIVLPFRI